MGPGGRLMARCLASAFANLRRDRCEADRSQPRRKRSKETEQLESPRVFPFCAFSRLFSEGERTMSKFNGIRGRIWFKALTGQDKSLPGDPSSVLTADAPIGDE